MNHTPGPWTFDPETGWVGRTKECGVVAWVEPYGPSREESLTDADIADGRLIAAAPNMLAALRLALAELEEWDRRLQWEFGAGVTVRYALDAAIRATRAAIADGAGANG